MKPIVGLPALFTGKHFFTNTVKNAAIITKVNADDNVNVAVFGENGNHFAVQNVRLAHTKEDIVQGEHYVEFHEDPYFEEVEGFAVPNVPDEVSTPLSASTSPASDQPSEALSSGGDTGNATVATSGETSSAGESLPPDHNDPHVADPVQ